MMEVKVNATVLAERLSQRIGQLVQENEILKIVNENQRSEIIGLRAEVTRLNPDHAELLEHGP